MTDERFLKRTRSSGLLSSAGVWLRARRPGSATRQATSAEGWGARDRIAPFGCSNGEPGTAALSASTGTRQSRCDPLPGSPLAIDQSNIGIQSRSATFQSQLIDLLLAAFPDKRRLLFVHIPKCAGTDLRENLRPRYPVLDWTLTETHWTDPSRLFASLETLIPQIRASDTMAVYGHVPLRWYLDNALKRPGDRILTVVRDPMEIVVSHVNYVLTALLLDPEAIRPDSRDWLRMLGIARLPAEPHEDFLAMTAERILLSDIVTSNYLCRCLGDGDAASAEELIRLSDIEITDVSRYSGWRSHEFGVTSCSRLNESRKFLHRATLTSPQFERVLQLTAEDRVLYGKIQNCLTNAPSLSIAGAALGRTQEASPSPERSEVSDHRDVVPGRAVPICCAAAPPLFMARSPVS